MGKPSHGVRLGVLLLLLLGSAFILSLGVSAGIGAPSAGSDQQVAPPAGIRQLVTDSEQIAFTLHLPAYEIDSSGKLSGEMVRGAPSMLATKRICSPSGPWRRP